MISARLSFEIINDSEIEILGAQRHGLGHVNSERSHIFKSIYSIPSSSFNANDSAIKFHSERAMNSRASGNYFTQP